MDVDDRPMQSSKGFTLIELMILVALVAIIATVALPSFTRLIESNRLTATTNDVVGTLTFARSEAIRRGRAVNVAARTEGGVTSWNNGITVTMGGGVIRVMDPVPARIDLEGDAFTFRGNGLASAARSFVVCGESGDGRVIAISGGGQVRVGPADSGECL